MEEVDMSDQKSTKTGKKYNFIDDHGFCMMNEQTKWNCMLNHDKLTSLINAIYDIMVPTFETLGIHVYFL